MLIGGLLLFEVVECVDEADEDEEQLVEDEKSLKILKFFQKIVKIRVYF